MNFEKYIDDKIRGKKVLEIGGIGDYKSYEKNDFKGWRRKRLKDISKELIAGDINKDGISFVNAKGFDFIHYDIENTNIVKEIGKFESILLLDVIEHLNNIGSALANVKNYMNEDSEFVISTPNPMALNNIVRTLLWKRTNTLGDHTVWIDEVNFQQLAKRYDFNIDEMCYFTFHPNTNIKQKIMNFLGGINKYFHQNIVVVLKLKK